MSWICDTCGSTEVSWNENVNELQRQKCGRIFDKEMPRLAAVSKDVVSERETCEACGLENAHLIAKCKDCGRKLCAEYCYEDMEFDKGLCLYCRKGNAQPL
jgi:hypothetical protein